MSKRRANNEGSIFQRGDGRWCVAVSIGGKQKRWYCKTSDEATATLKELHRQQIVGRNLSASDEPFGAYVLRWLVDTKANSVRQNTWEDYAALAKNHILPVLAEKRIGAIQTRDVQALYDKMASAGNSAQVIRKVHVLLGMAFRSMLPDKLIERDPTAHTSRPKLVKKKKLLFTAEQEQRFIDIVNQSKSQFKDVLQVYWELGGRISEVLGLKWASVFADHILIENVSMNTSQGPADALPKTPSSLRKVYLSPDCIATINRQPRRGAYVFCSEAGNAHSQRNWRTQWDRWLVQAFGAVPDETDKIKKPLIVITPHSLRHSQAVALFQAGWTVADVQIRGGWSSPKVLQEIYW